MSAVPAAPGVKGGRLRAPVGLAIALTALFALVIGLDVYAFHADWNTRSLMDRVLADPDAVSDAALDEGYLLMIRSGMFQSQIALVTGIVFIVWFHRTRLNAEAFAPGADRLSPGWAIGGWLVPFANLWLPYRIAVATWRSSTPVPADGRRYSLTLVNLWWGSFALAKILSWYGGRTYGRADTYEGARDAATVLLAADAVDIAAAILAVLFVRRLTAMQHARATLGPRPAAETPIPTTPGLPA
ncbi:DUF4328 domain-containing protein [Streptomyces sp. NPDC047014]|uniref:DUF4328 domain-containing protein n=1 Tax=Streptomyces sp. NPDC047014 TaxID=3155736 RepID=UPI0033CB6130